MTILIYIFKQDVISIIGRINPIPSIIYISLICRLIIAQTEINPDDTNNSHRNTNTAEDQVFNFPEFDYVESPKSEIAWREWEAACDQTPACLGLMNLDKVRCVRKCMSPSCYSDLYAFDELEEGEIDIRFHSFKGCFTQRIARRRY